MVECCHLSRLSGRQVRQKGILSHADGHSRAPATADRHGARARPSWPPSRRRLIFRSRASGNRFNSVSWRERLFAAHDLTPNKTFLRCRSSSSRSAKKLSRSVACMEIRMCNLLCGDFVVWLCYVVPLLSAERWPYSLGLESRVKLHTLFFLKSSAIAIFNRIFIFSKVFFT